MTAKVESTIAELTPLPMYPGYSANLAEGEVWRARKRLKPTPKGQVSVSISGVKSTVNVSWLIWSAIHGEVPECGIEHRDGDRGNSRLSNLAVAAGRHKPSRHCSKGHLLLADECRTWGLGNRICVRCFPGLPKVLPLITNYSMAYGTGQPPQE